ncbi:MAG: hypothetical protein AB8C02_14210 [Halioglobus sp.]
MFSNKHIVLALLVTPVLAVMAWYLTGHLFGEQPHPAVEGGTYPLVEQSNCRYPSGRCDLRNAELRVSIVATGDPASGTFLLTAQPGIDAAFLAFAPALNDNDLAPTPMQPLDEEGLRWQVKLAEPRILNPRFYLVVTAQGAHWYGEFGATFMSKEAGG